MSNEKRTYVRSPFSTADAIKRLANRGVVKVNIDEIVKAFAKEGVDRSHDRVAADCRATIWAAGGGMFSKALSSTIEDNTLTIRLTGEAPNITVMPRVIAKMIANGNKFSPTMAPVLAELGHDVEINPQATV